MVAGRGEMAKPPSAWTKREGISLTFAAFAFAYEICRLAVGSPLTPLPLAGGLAFGLWFLGSTAFHGRRLLQSGVWLAAGSAAGWAGYIVFDHSAAPTAIFSLTALLVAFSPDPFFGFAARTSTTRQRERKGTTKARREGSD